jgi:hypothetical protein
MFECHASLSFSSLGAGKHEFSKQSVALRSGGKCCGKRVDSFALLDADQLSELQL